MSSSQWLTLLCSDSPASQPDDQYTDHLLQVYRDYPRFNKPTDDTISRKPTVDDLESRLRFYKPNRRHVLPQADRLYALLSFRGRPTSTNCSPQADLPQDDRLSTPQTDRLYDAPASRLLTTSTHTFDSTSRPDDTLSRKPTVSMPHF